MAAITIIIPVRNRMDYLSTLFRSLSALTYEQLEVILVDNGSTDGSLGACRAYAEDAPMVVSVVSEPVPGANHARNRGLELCHTDWVYFFDSDDELSPSFLEEVMPRVGNHDMVAFPTRQCLGEQCAPRRFVPSDRPASQILSSTLNTQGMLFRTAFLRRIGGWRNDLEVWQDWELGIRALLGRPRILWLDERPFHLLHVHEESITGPSMSARLEARCHTLEVVAGEIADKADLRALYLRYCILEGMLRREGHPKELHRPSPSFWVKCLGKALRSYVGWGGRGAWRIALLFC